MSAIHFAVRSQRQDVEEHERRGDHDLGQRLAEESAQVKCGQHVLGADDHVGD